MKISLFLARRFIMHTSEKTMRTMMIIAFLSIMLGSFALALVAAIMNGFDTQTQKAIQGIQPDIIMNAGGRALSFEKLNSILNAYPFVKGVSPSAQGHALIKSPESDEVSSLVVVMAIDPEKEVSVSKLESMIKSDKPVSLVDLLKDDRILMGQSLAQSLAVKEGDFTTFLFTNDTHSTDNIMLEQHKMAVGGVFKTGIDDIDAHVVFVNFPLFKTLFPDQGITQIGMKLRDQRLLDSSVATLKERFPTLNVFSWKELYPAILSALILEKYAMFFILALITLVASMNIVALLFMYITTKKTEIAVLKTMGFSSRELVFVFVMIGVGISMLAACIGLVGAMVASYVLERYPFIALPEVYYVSHLPAHMDVSIVLAVLALVLIISFIASYIPARRVYTLDAAAVLKQMA